MSNEILHERIRPQKRERQARFANVLFVRGMPLSKRELRRVIDTYDRKLHDVANAGAFRGINKRIRYLHLIC